jgi:hypothetical protein
MGQVPAIRIRNISTHKTSYQYNGMSRLVGLSTDESHVKREMFGSDGYPGFDRFGRTASQTWKNTSTSAVLDRTDYTYDYAERLQHLRTVVVERDKIPSRAELLDAGIPCDEYFAAFLKGMDLIWSGF